MEDLKATIDVWTAPLEVPGDQLTRLADSLSPGERARARGYRFGRDARRFSAARGWLRLVLGAELGMAAAAVPLSTGPGKPRLLGGRALCFNLSHAGELALIAVAGRQVGIDVEHTDAGSAALAAAGVACTPGQGAALDRLAPAERAEAFLSLWTAKEAYLKATGLGLAVPPARVELGAEGPGGAAPVWTTGDAGAHRWWVRRLQPAPGYVGAVAAQGPQWEVRLRDAGDMGLDSLLGSSSR